eukprot:5160380-Amphidinium_carterae.2
MANKMKIGQKTPMLEWKRNRTPRVPSPSDAETPMLGGSHDQEVEAHERDHRTPRVRLQLLLKLRVCGGARCRS